MINQEIRILRHKLHHNHTYYSVGKVDSQGYTDNHFWSSSPEELKLLIEEALTKEPVDYKIRRFSDGN